MSNKDITIKNMNVFGKERKPFIFIIHSDMNNNEVHILDELDCSQILFDINDFTNYNEREKEKDRERELEKLRCAPKVLFGKAVSLFKK